MFLCTPSGRFSSTATPVWHPAPSRGRRWLPGQGSSQARAFAEPGAARHNLAPRSCPGAPAAALHHAGVTHTGPPARPPPRRPGAATGRRPRSPTSAPGPSHPTPAGPDPRSGGAGATHPPGQHRSPQGRRVPTPRSRRAPCQAARPPPPPQPRPARAPAVPPPPPRAGATAPRAHVRPQVHGGAPAPPLPLPGRARAPARRRARPPLPSPNPARGGGPAAAPLRVGGRAARAPVYRGASGGQDGEGACPFKKRPGCCGRRLARGGWRWCVCGTVVVKPRPAQAGPRYPPPVAPARRALARLPRWLTWVAGPAAAGGWGCLPGSLPRSLHPASHPALPGLALPVSCRGALSTPASPRWRPRCC